MIGDINGDLGWASKRYSFVATFVAGNAMAEDVVLLRKNRAALNGDRSSNPRGPGQSL